MSWDDDDWGAPPAAQAQADDDWGAPPAAQAQADDDWGAPPAAQAKADDDWGAPSATQAQADDDWGAPPAAQAQADDDWGAPSATQAQADDDWGAPPSAQAKADDDWGAPSATQAQADDDWGAPPSAQAQADDDWGAPPAAQAQADDWGAPPAEKPKTTAPPQSQAQSQAPVAQAPKSEPVRGAAGIRQLAGINKLLGPNHLNQGPEVKILQNALKALGFRVALNGHFDRPTLNALRTFQMQCKIPINGVFDKRSKNVMCRLWQKKQQKSAETSQSAEHAPNEDTIISYPQELPRFSALGAEQLSSDLGPPEQKETLHEGPEVMLLQKILIISGFELGFTGKFDKATYNALRKFQLKAGLPMTGVVGPKARRHLNAKIQEAQRFEKYQSKLWYVVYPFRKFHGFPVEDAWEEIVQDRIEQILSEIRDHNSGQMRMPEHRPERERPLLVSQMGTPGQQGIVSKGIEVERLQEVLLFEGYELKLNGQFDLQSFDALKRYQMDQGLAVTGVADAPTRDVLNQRLQEQYEGEKAQSAFLKICVEFQLEQGLQTSDALEEALKSKLKTLLKFHYLPLQEDLGPKNRAHVSHMGPDVVLLKCLLQEAGFELNTTMFFDSETAQALKDYQKQAGLPSTGMLDAKTREHLNARFAQGPEQEIEEL